jgi:reactive intermediate/imine deaminase
MTPLECIHPEGLYKGPVPLSLAVRAGKFLFVSGIPGFDEHGGLAIGDFSTQMRQVMDNITRTLNAAGAGWDRVAKTTVLLVRREDFGEMNRIYSAYFPSGQYPARTTMYVASLPQADFLLEIECVAALE